MHAGHLDIAPELAGNRAGPGQRSRERNLAHPAIQVRTNLSQVRWRGAYDHDLDSRCEFGACLEHGEDRGDASSRSHSSDNGPLSLASAITFWYSSPDATVRTLCLGCTCDPAVSIGICRRNRTAVRVRFGSHVGRPGCTARSGVYMRCAPRKRANYIALGEASLTAISRCASASIAYGPRRPLRHRGVRAPTT